MSKEASNFQKKTMSFIYRGKEIFKPLNTGWIDDHVGAVERDSDGLFKNATLYLSEIENRYMTGEVRRRVMFHAYKLPMVISDNKRVLLKDRDILRFGDIKVEAILVPGHTWGHMVYLVDDAYPACNQGERDCQEKCKDT